MVWPSAFSILQMYLYCTSFTTLQKITRETLVYISGSGAFPGKRKREKKGIVFNCELRRCPLDTLKYDKHDSSKGILGKKHLAQKAYLKIHCKFKGHENAA